MQALLNEATISEKAQKVILKHTQNEVKLNPAKAGQLSEDPNFLSFLNDQLKEKLKTRKEFSKTLVSGAVKSFFQKDHSSAYQEVVSMLDSLKQPEAPTEQSSFFEKLKKNLNEGSEVDIARAALETILSETLSQDKTIYSQRLLSLFNYLEQALPKLITGNSKRHNQISSLVLKEIKHILTHKSQQLFGEKSVSEISDLKDTWTSEISTQTELKAKKLQEALKEKVKVIEAQRVELSQLECQVSESQYNLVGKLKEENSFYKDHLDQFKDSTSQIYQKRLETLKRDNSVLESQNQKLKETIEQIRTENLELVEAYQQEKQNSVRLFRERKELTELMEKDLEEREKLIRDNNYNLKERKLRLKKQKNDLEQIRIRDSRQEFLHQRNDYSYIVMGFIVLGFLFQLVFNFYRAYTPTF